MGRLDGLRQAGLGIFSEALRAADPLEAVHRWFRLKESVIKIGEVDYFLNQFKHIWVIGAGKASARMAKAIEECLSDRITGGLVIVKYGYGETLKKILVKEAGHPIPDQAGISATRELMDLAKTLEKEDLAINLISGGGSSLLVAPADGVSLEDQQTITELMLRSGMKIGEINLVRKHLSRVKGGRLAEILYPATVISLIFSDVIGDRLEVIASGPTAPDSTTYSEAIGLVRKYQLWDQIPESVRKVLTLGAAGKLSETPRADHPAFSRAQNLVIASNRLSLESARYCASKLGFNTVLLSSAIQGEARELAKVYGSIFREMLKSGNPIKPPACVIAGGEPTVTVKGKGKGGRSQELALAVAMEIQGMEGALFVSAGTDGTDGPTDAAGAVADWETISRAWAREMDPDRYLSENDSYNFFQPLGDLIITGPTRTNVMDVHILLVG